MNLEKAAALRRWHRKVLRHDARQEKGGKPRAPPAEPSTDEIFQNPQFGKFANLYCKVNMDLLFLS